MIITDKFFGASLLITVLAIIVINNKEILNFFYKNCFALESSVWCSKGSKKTSLCRFKNVCYDPEYKSLLFFLSEKTIIKGFSHYKDLQKIQLSSVYSHNKFYANLSVVDSARYQNNKQILLFEKVFLFSRFKPNNLMHSVHDDLFPLFLTLESACLGDIDCMEKYNLVMFDHYPKGPYFKLYSLFSDNPPIVLSEQEFKSNLLCFKEMLTGLIQDGIFFEYGFDKPHGPVKPSLLNQNDIYRFTMFIKSKLKVKKKDTELLEVVLIKRMKSRKILNINEVEEMIKNAYQRLSKKIILRIINLELSVNVSHLIKIISRANVLIGMHGAEMILSIFLKPNSVVFELFPFGIQPGVVSFIKPISELENSELVYFSWRNMYRNHSSSHAEAHPLFGGIIHLDKTTQEKIKTISEVPPVKCCNDPLYLHYMYQDTHVSNEFGDFFYASVSEFYSRGSQIITDKMIKKWFFPYKITDLNCDFHLESRQINLTWRPPFNVNPNFLDYRLFVKDESGYFEKEFSTKKLNVQLEVPNESIPKFHVWISVYFDINNSESPDLYIECS